MPTPLAAFLTNAIIDVTSHRTHLQSRNVCRFNVLTADCESDYQQGHRPMGIAPLRAQLTLLLHPCDNQARTSVPPLPLTLPTLFYRGF